MKRTISAIIISSLLLIRCSSATKEKEQTTRQLIEQGNKEIATAFIKKDTALLRNIYTANPIIAPDGGKLVTGLDSSLQYWANVFHHFPLVDMQVTTSHFKGSDLIYETGIAVNTFKQVYNDSSFLIKDTVKYMNIWEKQPDGKLKLQVDFWNNYTEMY
jgi:ketosteroid isomerase-like protein